MLLQLTEPGQNTSPKKEVDDIAVGIDLGTTNSLIAIKGTDGNVSLFTDEDGNRLYPSVYKHKGFDIHSIKRLMGKSLSDAQRLGYTHFPLDTSKDTGLVHLNLDGQSLSPVEISAKILSKLKNEADSTMGRDVKKAVITVPAYFDEAARTATKDAAKIAGFDVLRLINEPTAAALAYGLDSGAMGTFVVFDLGGGTFDVSILKLTNGVFQVLATGGDANLGGDDIDHFLATKLFNTEKPTQEQLLYARKKKEDPNFSKTSVDNNRYFLEATTSVAIQAMGILRETLDSARLTEKDLDGIILVGGSTRLKEIKESLAKNFSTEIFDNLNPDEIVAIGAAQQAYALVHGSENLLLDVVPLSLGIETMGGIVEKIIPRNSPLPISKAQDFTTFKDGQTSMYMHVLQGEREMVSDLKSLAKFTLGNIPAVPAGQARVRVIFTVDADGLLTVSAEETHTKQKQTIEVKPTYGLSLDRVSELLRESLEHGKQDIEKRLWIEAKVEAEQLLIAVSAALEKDSDLLSSDEITQIHSLHHDVKTFLDSKEREKLLAASKKLESSTQTFAERRMEKSIKSALMGQNIS